jgi:hypothetical protein
VHDVELVEAEDIPDGLLDQPGSCRDQLELIGGLDEISWSVEDMGLVAVAPGDAPEPTIWPPLLSAKLLPTPRNAVSYPGLGDSIFRWSMVWIVHFRDARACPDLALDNSMLRVSSLWFEQPNRRHDEVDDRGRPWIWIMEQRTVL